MRYDNTKGYRFKSWLNYSIYKYSEELMLFFMLFFIALIAYMFNW